MSEMQTKSFDRPDEERPFDHGKADVVRLGELTVGRQELQPGWKWSEHVKPIAGTELCEYRHIGYTLSGRMMVTWGGLQMEIAPGGVFDIPSGHDAWVIGDEPWVGLQWAGISTWGAPLLATGERVLTTLLFTDIVDSTATLERLGDVRWRELLTGYRQAAASALEHLHGREVTATGDGFLATFDGPARAVRCAAAIRRDAIALNLRTRSGIHTGEVELIGTDVRGVTVHIASRITNLAEADEILVSGTTHELIGGTELEFSDRGSHQLKGVTGPRQVFRLEG
jgi:class 3 adenylate cyclase